MTHDAETLTQRETLQQVTAAQLLSLLPRMDRLMVIGQSGGVTHERIGPVETVRAEGGRIRLAGACHDSDIDPHQVVSIVLDTGSVMRDKVYPRLDFLGRDGAPVLSVVGMEGLDPFTAPLSGFPRGPAAPRAERPADSAAPAEFADDDPARAPFAAALDSAAEIRITYDRAGLRQSWQGRIEALKPAMGFLNVMTPDFHLHLRGRTVSGWQQQPGRRIALDHDGQPAGLILDSGVFA